MSGFAASNFGESFCNSIIAGLFTAAIVTVFCSALATDAANKTATKENATGLIMLDLL
jgi:hypothetical protein